MQNILIYSYIFEPQYYEPLQLLTTMKVLMKIALCMFLPFSIMAQSNQEELDFIQSIFGMEKKAIVSEFIELEGPSKDAFWSLYDQYETERKELGQNRLSILNDYAENYENMSDDKINELAKRSTKQVKGDESLRYKYFNKMKKAAGAKAAAQFYQIEGYFNAAIRMSILESIPFIGELDN